MFRMKYIRHKNARAIFACMWTSFRRPTRITSAAWSLTEWISFIHVCVIVVVSMLSPLQMLFQFFALTISHTFIHLIFYCILFTRSLSWDGFVFRSSQSIFGILVESKTVHYRCMQFAHQAAKVEAMWILYVSKKKRNHQKHFDLKHQHKSAHEKRTRRKGFNKNIHIFAHFICT